MIRRTSLPSREGVQLAITEITTATGRPPSALAVARRLGVANTTFRRHFPGITAELTQQRSPTPALADNASDTAGITRFDQLTHENARLRSDNHDLSEHLGLAVAHIQRLTLDNHQMRQQLEAGTNVTHIDTGHRQGTPGGRAP